MKRNINALIEGGLPKPKGFAPMEQNNRVEDHYDWLVWRLQVADIPVSKIKNLLGFTLIRFVLECECSIAQFNERAHNSGLKFKYCRPSAGTNTTCIVEVEVQPEP